jgi:hypothetical protein
MPEIADRPGDAVVAPGRVLLCHGHDQFFDLGRNRWPAVTFLQLRTVEFLRDQLPVPFQDRLRLDDRDGVSHQLSHGDGLFRKDAPFGIGQQNPLADLVTQNTVLLKHIFDPSQELFVDFSCRIGQHLFPRHQQLSRFDWKVAKKLMILFAMEKEW